MKKPLLIIVGGPTGIGKTATAITLAQHLKTEIISSDSRQVYKELSIGTAVPSAEELRAVKHHFIHNKSIDERFNASMYEFEVLALLKELYKIHKVVVMVGGSGLYIDAVCNGIDELPTIPLSVRLALKESYDLGGLEKLQLLVQNIDPEYYESVDTNNYKRLLKALEVYEVTKKPYSTFLKKKPKERFFDTLKINLNIDREILYNQINLRVEKMVDAGLVEEAKTVYRKRHLTPLKTVGYRELFEHFDGAIGLEEAIIQVKNHTRAYARKQLTWFRRYKEAYWFSPEQTNEMLNLINQHI